MHQINTLKVEFKRHTYNRERCMFIETLFKRRFCFHNFIIHNVFEAHVKMLKCGLVLKL